MLLRFNSTVTLRKDADVRQGPGILRLLTFLLLASSPVPPLPPPPFLGIYSGLLQSSRVDIYLRHHPLLRWATIGWHCRASFCYIFCPLPELDSNLDVHRQLQPDG